MHDLGCLYSFALPLSLLLCSLSSFEFLGATQGISLFLLLLQLVIFVYIAINVDIADNKTIIIR